jgi:hypothetical protein
MGSLSVAWVVDSFPHCSVTCHYANPKHGKIRDAVISLPLVQKAVRPILAQEQGLLPTKTELIAG